jgi:hypothetical protein
VYVRSKMVAYTSLNETDMWKGFGGETMCETEG